MVRYQRTAHAVSSMSPVDGCLADEQLPSAFVRLQFRVDAFDVNLVIGAELLRQIDSTQRTTANPRQLGITFDHGRQVILCIFRSHAGRSQRDSLHQRPRRLQLDGDRHRSAANAIAILQSGGLDLLAVEITPASAPCVAALISASQSITVPPTATAKIRTRPFPITGSESSPRKRSSAVRGIITAECVLRLIGEPCGPMAVEAGDDDAAGFGHAGRIPAVAWKRKGIARSPLPVSDRIASARARAQMREVLREQGLADFATETLFRTESALSRTPDQRVNRNASLGEKPERIWLTELRALADTNL